MNRGNACVLDPLNSQIAWAFCTSSAGPLHEITLRMARRRRIQHPDLIRHVMARGNGRMCIFLDDMDYRHFVHFLGDIVEEFEIECWNYCLMPNHYHATLRPTRTNLSEAIRRLNGRYAQWWNKRHERDGHVFQGRFKDQIVQRDDYLLALCRYVSLNPVRAKLVEHPDDWPWSSYGATVGTRPPPGFLDVGSTLRLFGDEEEPILQHRFAQYIDQPDDRGLDDRIRSKEWILGGGEFKALVRTESDRGRGSDPARLLASARTPVP